MAINSQQLIVNSQWSIVHRGQAKIKNLSFILYFLLTINCQQSTVLAETGNEFIYAQLKYDGEWDPYPEVAVDVLKFLADTTNADVYPERRLVAATDTALLEYPFLVILGKDRINFSELEIKGLRRYLENGGFVFVDDCGDFSHRIKEEMLKIVPNAYWKEIARDHAVYRSFFLLGSARGRKPGGHSLEGIDIHGYTSVVLSPNDVHGAWAKDLLGNYLFTCEPGGEVQRMSAIKLMINVIMYSLTGTYKTDAIHQPFIEQKLGR